MDSRESVIDCDSEGKRASRFESAGSTAVNRREPWVVGEQIGPIESDTLWSRHVKCVDQNSGDMHKRLKF